MSKKKEPPTDDRALFRQQMDDVEPLSQDKIPPYRQRRTPRPLHQELDDEQVLHDMMSDAIDFADVETGEELFFARPGLQHNLLRKLRWGQFSTEAVLDLHRMTSDQARQAILQFLQQCRIAGKRSVRIIHGKGLGSEQKIPVLKGKVNHWLKQKDEVLAFCSARPVDGGTGAIYVLLKKTVWQRAKILSSPKAELFLYR